MVQINCKGSNYNLSLCVLFLCVELETKGMTVVLQLETNPRLILLVIYDWHWLREFYIKKKNEIWIRDVNVSSTCECNRHALFIPVLGQIKRYRHAPHMVLMLTTRTHEANQNCKASLWYPHPHTKSLTETERDWSHKRGLENHS